ncbi:uncharacterized protein PITG_22330 [Phytophthora infestans T30-4]|uniref:Uncharacterized protein n=1 Tax=Phytophthora infestans (strain T30-4) TaxID=403677 RepID=D0RM56_PHYIT|nr:uncharacterized protein PITG_22330 [Phytophthora infestans T30-4]EEY59320.1 hypothetical protein PITG_22330 [Phytophthora infestans T30-4]|eukprot:XP_002909874.1 hypothetical protein PITG_22330 [Phytophthora infestans T30-4]
MPYFCENPLATSRALNRSISPAWFSLMRNTQRQLIAFRPWGNGTNDHVLFLRRESTSELHASFHLAALLDSIADLNVVGISPTESTTVCGRLCRLLRGISTGSSNDCVRCVSLRRRRLP